MITYGKLQSRFNELKNQETEYWGHLRDALESIVERTAQLLAVPNNRTLRLGAIKESGEFETLAPSNIPAVSRELKFALLLVLSETKSETPPSTLETRWTIWREGRELMLSSRTQKISVASYDQAAQFIVHEFGRVLEQSDPFAKTDIF